MAFPTLFPDGKGDPTNLSLNRDVHFDERIKHLKYAEEENGCTASLPTLGLLTGLWITMIQWKRILQQTGIFLKQNPGEAHLTTEDLQQMAANANSSVFLSKISRYLRNITGSSAYWQKAKEDLTAIITHAGPPTFFFTFSSADLHWPELHALLKSDNTDPTVENHRDNVINNPNITNWFFTQRLESFIIGYIIR